MKFNKITFYLINKNTFLMKNKKIGFKKLFEKKKNVIKI